MELLTQELLAKLPPLYSTNSKGEAPVIARLHSPTSTKVFYITEGHKSANGGYLLFGLYVYRDRETRGLGYVSLDELIERDFEVDREFVNFVLDYKQLALRRIEPAQPAPKSAADRLVTIARLSLRPAA